MMYTNFEQFSIKKEPGIKEETMPVNDRTLPLKENSRDILMDFGMNRKKVLHLDGSNSLLTECKKHVCSDPALSDLLSHSYLVFQEFTPKFNTWVDIDSENNLRDGSVVKVLFFPKVVETDGLNPGSIKRKRDNVDIEANPKQYRISGDIGIKSNSLNRGDENGRDDVGNKRNEVMYVDLTERYDKSHSFETRGSEGELVNQAATPSPVTRKKQNFLLPKTIKADVHVTSTNVQPENLKDIESADLCPDFLHLPSYTVEQRTGVLSEQQTLNERIPHNPILNEEHSKKKNQKKKKVTPSRAQSLRIVNRKENGSKSSAANVTCARVQSLSVSNQQGNSPHSSSVNISSTNVQPQNFSEMEAALIHPESLLPSYVVEETTGAMLSGGQMNITPSRLQPLLLQENQHPSSPQSSCSGRVGNLIGMEFMAPGTSTPAKTHTVFEAKPPANSTQKPAPNPKVYERSISWTYHILKEMRLKRLSWGQQNLETIWCNTVFSDVAFFGLEGNYIKYYEKLDFSKTGSGSEIFWGLRSFDGPNIMAPLGFSLLGSKFAQVLRNKVIRSIKDHYRTGNVTLQFPGSLKTQFDSKIVRDVLKINSIAVSEWPSSARDLSPIRHAWKLVSEKVKNIQCFSNQQMISILLGVWEKDSDVQLMCSKVITLLPQIIKSVVEQNGSYPRVNARYIMTT